MNKLKLMEGFYEAEEMPKEKSKSNQFRSKYKRMSS